jgi:glycerol kinase
MKNIKEYISEALKIKSNANIVNKKLLETDFKSLKEIESKIQILKEYKNTMNTKTRFSLLEGWHKAVRKTIGDN